jgi:hypothetical protein
MTIALLPSRWDSSLALVVVADAWPDLFANGLPPVGVCPFSEDSWLMILVPCVLGEIGILLVVALVA